MKLHSQIRSRQQGRARPAAIAGVIVVGIVLGALILMMDKGRHVSAGDDDAPAAATPAAKDAKAGAKADTNTDPKDAASAGTAAAAHTAHVAMEDAQVKASAIDLQVAGPARVHALAQFPGEVQLNDDRTVHVVPRVAGIAESVLVTTGQTVKKGQVLAVFSSQLVSELRSVLQTAERRLEHMQSLYEREKRLWEQKISAEQDYLQAQHSVQEAEIDLENAKQKLAALGVGKGSGAMNRFELRAAYDGLVVERSLSIGEAVKEDTPIFTIADMSTVWVEAAIPAKDLPLFKVGDKVTLRATAFDAQTVGTVAFLGALVGEQTRMARARLLVPNPKGTWRPGLFVNIEVKATDAEVPVAVQTEALQTLGTQQVVFVRDGKNFVAHPVTLGRSDGDHVEIVQGLKAGARYAAHNSYIIKSEMSKLASEEGY
jgi:cobalt-zinc-cadmium efflux system membrane fusion protein